MKNLTLVSGKEYAYLVLKKKFDMTTYEIN